MIIKTDRYDPIFVPVRSAVCAEKIVAGSPHAPLLRSHSGLATGRCQACPVQGLSLCDSLRPEEIAELDSMVGTIDFRDRTTLFDQGSPDTHVYVVGSGMVRLFKVLPDGRRLVLGFALPGDFLGLSLDERHACSAEALGEVSTCRIEREAYSRFLDSKPHLLRRFHTETAQELSIAQDQMMLLGRCTAREKMAVFLLTLRSRWQRVNGQSVNISLPMTRQDIADYIGVTIETASRMISAFSHEKLLMIVPDGVRVLNLPGLEAIAAG
jgi:CRP/FNR family transcriptional regulator